MNIRLTVLSLSIPLFLLLGGLNGALLIQQEMTEMERALDDQAVVAAVTVAAFAAAAPDPARYLTHPERLASVQKTAMEIPELQALYLVQPHAVIAHLIKPAGTVPLSRLDAPERPMVLPVGANAQGRRVVAALAPVSRDMFIVSEVDAEPLYARIAELKRVLVGILIVAGLIGSLLALLVARRVKRELAQNQIMIAAIARGDPRPPAAEFLIQETRDLAAAVRLMGTSLAAGLERGRRAMAERDLRRGEADGVAAHQRAVFAPISQQCVGVAVEVRLLGDAPAGCFFALCESPEGKRGALVMGECAANTPATALALALVARNFFQTHMCDGAAADVIAMGKSAFELTRVTWLEWSDSDTWTRHALALLDGKSTERAAAYVGQMGMLDPDQVMDDLTALLPVSGVLAVLSRQPCPSADLGEGGFDGRLDLEDA